VLQGDYSMEELKLLEEKIGGSWTGITFNRRNTYKKNLAKRPMRLCEAIKDSRTQPIVLTPRLVSCPGALRSLGWTNDADDKIAFRIAEATNSNLYTARKLVSNMPHLKGCDSVTVGRNSSPDIAISYAQPVAAMRLVRLWQLTNGTDLDMEVSSVMAVCGSVVARVHITGRICISFGCPDSRKHGAIGRDRLVIGLPVGAVRDFV
jgi:uncharacterized protein (DUF169 family)